MERESGGGLHWTLPAGKAGKGEVEKGRLAAESQVARWGPSGLGSPPEKVHARTPHRHGGGHLLWHLTDDLGGKCHR